MLLDIIGIVLAFSTAILLFSFLVTAIVQFMQSLFKWRYRNLKLGLQSITEFTVKQSEQDVDSHLLSRLLDNALIPKIQLNHRKFYRLLHFVPRNEIALNEVKQAIAEASGYKSQSQLTPELVIATDTFFTQLEKEMSLYFTRRTHFWSFIIAGVVSFVFQLNSFELLKNISQNTEQRQHLSNFAQQVLEKQLKNCDRGLSAYQCLNQSTQRLQLFDFRLVPNGLEYYKLWKIDPQCHAKTGRYLAIACLDKQHHGVWNWLGMIFSTILISMGAPFWFERIKDLLQLKQQLKKTSS